MLRTADLHARGPYVRGLFALWMAILALPVPAGAQPSRSEFRVWVETLWPLAKSEGVSRKTFDTAFRGVVPDYKLPGLALPSRRAKPGLSKGQAEFIKPPKHYMRARYLAQLAKRGRRLNRKWRRELTAIETRFGVDRAVLLAIWGRETSFGGYKVKHDAIRAIATQAFVGERAERFRTELILALKILQEGHIARKDMRSSWAGAMGMTQMLPSDFYRYAADGDGDGKRDIWRSVPDALASAAKSLLDNGWTKNRPWGYEVRKPARVDCALEGPRNLRPLRDWIALGYSRTFDRRWPQDRLDEPHYLLMPEGARGPAFLMHNNFLVLKSYNFADLYALFVGNLADRINGGGKFEQAWATDRQLSKARIAEIQERLNTGGYKAGKVDGRAGTITRNAIGGFQKANNLRLDCYPSPAVLKALQRDADG